MYDCNKWRDHWHLGNRHSFTYLWSRVSSVRIAFFSMISRNRPLNRLDFVQEYGRQGEKSDKLPIQWSFILSIESIIGQNLFGFWSRTELCCFANGAERSDHSKQYQGFHKSKLAIDERCLQDVDAKFLYLLQDLNSCLVVNPGQLTENAVRGTFGRLVITPASAEQKALNSFMACQIIKL